MSSIGVALPFDETWGMSAQRYGNSCSTRVSGQQSRRMGRQLTREQMSHRSNCSSSSRSAFLLVLLLPDNPFFSCRLIEVVGIGVIRELRRRGILPVRIIISLVATGMRPNHHLVADRQRMAFSSFSWRWEHSFRNETALLL